MAARRTRSRWKRERFAAAERCISRACLAASRFRQWTRDAPATAGGTAALRSLRQQHGQDSLALREGGAHLAFDEQRVGERAQRAESYLIFDHVADQRSVDPVA